MLPLTTITVVATTPVEVAEERLARDVALLADDLLAGEPLDALRRDRAHVALDERRLRSLRALPAGRAAHGAQAPRRLLAAAYGRLAAACHRRGLEDECAAALGRAAAERAALATDRRAPVAA